MLDTLDYYIMDSQVSGQTSLLDNHNSVYKFWKNIWTPTLQKMKLPPLDKNQILRQDYICFLKCNNNIIGSHFYSKFDVRLAITPESTYFRDSFTDVNKYCTSNNIKTIMTQEYLSVHPEWRKQKSSLSIPEIIIGLAIKMMSYTHCDSTAGTIRAGAPSVERISKEINADLLPVIIQRYNMPHKLFILPSKKAQQPGSPFIQKAINNLWNNKIDLTTKSIKNKSYKIAS